MINYANFNIILAAASPTLNPSLYEVVKPDALFSSLYLGKRVSITFFHSSSPYTTDFTYLIASLFADFSSYLASKLNNLEKNSSVKAFNTLALFGVVVIFQALIKLESCILIKTHLLLAPVFNSKSLFCWCLILIKP
jgi:hypothetical protein